MMLYLLAMRLPKITFVGTTVWYFFLLNLFKLPFSASLGLISPATLGVSLALLLGVRGEALGVLFLLLATPVAASSHVMVVAARGDGALAASMVVLSTLLSVVTITLGFFLLSLLGLVAAPH